jgi:predicted nucleic acid-binding protein
MTVVVDTSVLAAFVNPKDSLHSSAARIMAEILAGEHGRAVSSEFVLAEGLALLRSRPGNVAISRQFLALFQRGHALAPGIQLAPADRIMLDAAVKAHFKFYDRGLSLTDALLLLLAEASHAPIASFDDGFDGLVERIAG